MRVELKTPAAQSDEGDRQPAQRGRVVEAVRDLQGMTERRDAQRQAGEREVWASGRTAPHRVHFSSRNSSACRPAAGNVP